MLKSFYDGTSYGEDYVHITLTDEDDIPDAVSKLRTVYKNLMKLEYDNKRTRARDRSEAVAADVETKTPLELFDDLFAMQNNETMNEQEHRYMSQLIESVWEGEA